jgi:transcription-repair coupling factor (superfamily II helicase)
MSNSQLASPFNPPLPDRPGHIQYWGRLYGSSTGLVISQAAERHHGPVVVVTPDTATAQRLEYALRFYLGKTEVPLLRFADWETLPYDVFSPHQDIISDRLAALYRLPDLKRGVLIVPVQTLMHRISPPSFISAHSLLLDMHQTIDMDAMRSRLEASGYSCVSSVLEHGEFAVRGSLLDLYPMGSRTPFRIELFDNEIESIRTFDPETQRSIEKVDQIRLLPAREFPLDKEAITRFRKDYRSRFEGDPGQSAIYRDISNGIAPPGIEYYLPLFFETTANLFDYLPANTLLVTDHGLEAATDHFWEEVTSRYEQGRHNIERPLLAPAEVFVPSNEVFAELKRFLRVDLQPFEQLHAQASNFATNAPVNLLLDMRADRPAAILLEFLDKFDGRVLFAAETTGRREFLLDLLHQYDIRPRTFSDWHSFLASDDLLGITVAPLEQGLSLNVPRIEIVAEPQLFGLQVLQRRRRKRTQRDSDAIIRNLVELTPGVPVVHEDHGVGRYLGLQSLTVGGIEQEFLTLEYAGGDKLYVPVASLHLISRYTGTAPDTAPLHKLGSGQWERAKRKASERVRDVAAELLDVYARREARSGFAYPFDEHQYLAFTNGFPFEETPDQKSAIDSVITNLRSNQPMDHLVCGDVGFGKTEVAMRAAFIAVAAGKQVAVLAPTTLLTQQHLENFRDRFADWPIRVESLSRFRSKKEQTAVVAGLESGAVDIVIGTHKLLQEGIKFKRLGLVIIDEEHRFGVRQKERFKALRAEVDVLTLTATPIPRTLNMALSGLRELSIIASPPARRLAIKTFVSEWNDQLMQEACLREIKRGGQVYLLHNDIDTIEKQAQKIAELVPEATVHFAHGQMRERELEQVMSDFYHQRFNILVCTTIIETGIDIPSANTIIINRADKFGLAQLYQLRGRVGRSHHRAYAYLIIPSRKLLSADAEKRLAAIESMEELGAGFTLATHDLEIRGAGELLGDEQSGHMHEIGYTLYTELLERAVKALKEGREPQLDKPLAHGTEVDLHIPALIPDDYLPDIHERLIIYKRIANCTTSDELRELQVEMIDRFGLLPEQTKTLFQLTELKLKATPLGITKIDIGDKGGRITFCEQPDIDPVRIIQLIQNDPAVYKLDGNERLRINRKLDEPAARFRQVTELIDMLSQRDAA